ncbi:hypothetical protein T265_02914 [Opisthorchis viverrini]|uniref:Uncharacterized protein n=1 Tax=Opisthorchis viverrini TaxID=6198 RepID=A0A074ZXM4_OPIVI|nr:hypothetical protein T265_02914 [Opisthorchis viverrini]KER30667.1 hypothetical protein T265_02914 [Opisthorchis viverrini]
MTLHFVSAKCIPKDVEAFVISSLLLKIRQQPTTDFALLGAHQPQSPSFRQLMDLATLWNIYGSGTLLDCRSLHPALQLNCKRFITNRGDIVHAALKMSPRWAMKRLQCHCQAQRTDRKPNQ